MLEYFFKIINEFEHLKIDHIFLLLFILLECVNWLHLIVKRIQSKSNFYGNLNTCRHQLTKETTCEGNNTSEKDLTHKNVIQKIFL